MAEDHFQEEGMERQDTREAGEKAPAKEPCDFLNVVRMATEKLSKEVSKKLSHHELETPYKINPVNSARINSPTCKPSSAWPSAITVTTGWCRNTGTSTPAWSRPRSSPSRTCKRS